MPEVNSFLGASIRQSCNNNLCTIICFEQTLNYFHLIFILKKNIITLNYNKKYKYSKVIKNNLLGKKILWELRSIYISVLQDLVVVGDDSTTIIRCGPLRRDVAARP